jgi:hypothetical protein
MINLNNLPCELGLPGNRPGEVDPIDGGRIEEPDDDDPKKPDPPQRVPTVWACEELAASPGAGGATRTCKEYYITQIPEAVISVHSTKEECERFCYPVVACVRNEITQQLECVTFPSRAAYEAAGSPGTEYPDLATCRIFCKDKPEGQIVWACEEGAGEGSVGGKICNAYDLTSAPAGTLYLSLADCEDGCYPVIACVPNRLTGAPECISFPSRAAYEAAGSPGIEYPDYATCFLYCKEDKPETDPVIACVRNEITLVLGCVTFNSETEYIAAGSPGFRYTSLADCEAECREVVPPDGGGGGGPNPGTPVGPRPPAGPATPFPGPPGGGGGGPTNPGTPMGPGTPAGPATPSPGPPGGGGGPSTGGGGPSTPRTRPRTGERGTITRYVCGVIGLQIVPCKPRPFTSGGAGGLVTQEYDLVDQETEDTCRCMVVVTGCKPVTVNYVGPYPPEPLPGQYYSCVSPTYFPADCNKTTIRLIPNTCPNIIPNPDLGLGSYTPLPGGNKNIPEDNTDGVGIIVTPTDATEISPEELPTPNNNQDTPISQDGKPLGEYQYKPSDLVFEATETFSFFDETYTANIPESRYTILTKSNLYLELFNIERDFRIESLLEEGSMILENLNQSMDSISYPLLRDSIRSEIRDIIFNITYPDGRAIPQHKIVKALKRHILENTVDQIDAGYILFLKYRSLLSEEVVSNLVNLPPVQFGKSQLDIIKERQNIKNRTTTVLPVSNIAPSQTRGILRALGQSKPLDPRKYTGLEQDLLKLWYILPTDINRRLEVSSASSVEKIYIQDSDTFSVTTHLGSSVNVPVSRLHYEVSVTLTTSSTVTVSSNSDIDRAYILPNIVEQASLYDVGSIQKTTLTVTSPSASNLELNYSLSATRPAYYILKINKNNISEVSDLDSICTKKTRVEYTLETSMQVIEDLTKFRIYPWKVLTINHQDPILGHFDASSVYEIEYTSFNLNQFGTDSGEQLFVRQIPELVVVLPTNKFNFNFYNGKSTLLDWNVRTLNFIVSPDTRYSRTKLDQHWLKIEDTYPNTDIDDTLTYYGKRGVLNVSESILSAGFKNNEEPLPRKKHGFRAAVETASSIYLNYKVEGGILWSDLLIRLTEDQYKTFDIGITDTMIDKLRMGEKTGVKLFHNRNDIFNKNSRILNLRSSSSEEVPIKIIKNPSKEDRLNA